MPNTKPKNTAKKSNREEQTRLLDKAIRPSPAQLPEVETEHKNIDYISYVPLDKKKYPNYIETFGRRIAPSFIRGKTKDEDGKAIITYTTKAGGGELTYRFDEDLLVRELGKDATKKLPTLGRRASNLWYSMIYFAKQQGDGIEGNFTASEIMRLWGKDDPSKGGRAFKDIRETFFNVVAVMPSYTNKRSGDERLDWGFAFTSSYMIKGEGREARYYYTMTPEALGLTEKWLKGELTVEEIKNKGGYLAYPLKYLEGGLDETEQNFRDYLLKFKGGYTVKAYTILKDWLKLRNDLLRRRKYCYDLLYRYLESAKERGEISSYKFEVRALKDWRKKWRVTIYKSTDAAKVNRTKRGKRGNTAEQDELDDSPCIRNDVNRVSERDTKVSHIKNTHIRIYIDKFNLLFEKNFRVTSTREKKLKIRLKEFSLEEVLKALENLHANPFYRGKNDSGWVADPDFLIRSDEQLDKFLNKSVVGKKPSPILT